jgi:tRNA (adenine37-N6)-methyltransferase
MEQNEPSQIGAIYELICLKPVGVVRNQSTAPSWGARSNTADWRATAAGMKTQSQAISELVINADLDGILDGIEEYSHITVLYWAHLVPEKNRLVKKTHPLGSHDFPLVGVFATHSPARPNSILTTTVRLLGREGNILKVTGLDALNGSPILDIKPYLPDSRDLADVKMPDWMKKMNEVF